MDWPAFWMVMALLAVAVICIWGPTAIRRIRGEWHGLGRSEPEASGEPALPIDVDDPPRWRPYHFTPKPGKERVRCRCHDEPLEDGDVLWWPMPNSNEVRVFCQRAAGGLRRR